MVATVNAGYHFLNWTEAGSVVSSNDQYDFTALSDRVLVANFDTTPTVTTTSVSGIGTTSAASGGEVTSDGGGSVTARGVCWNTTGSPTTEDAHTVDGTGTGAFASSLAGLSPGTLYHVRAYATNDAGTSYGNEVSFTTQSTPVPYTVSARISRGRGSISPALQTVARGGTASIVITPVPGYHIVSITDNGSVRPVGNPYVITNVKADHEVVVALAPDAAESFTVIASVSGGHGGVSPASQQVARGAAASISIDPDPGYAIASITDNGAAKGVANPYVIADVRQDHDVVVTFAPHPQFQDVPPGSSYYGAIENLAALGIINGMGDGSFDSDAPVSRQQFAKMIVKTLELTVTGNEACPFIDVQRGLDTNDPLYPDKYVAVCAAHGITVGRTSGTFAPYASITRQQLMTMVARAAGLAQPPAGWQPGFTRTQFSLEEHFANARMAAYAGLLAGLPGIGPSYDFTAPATRGECAQLLWALWEWRHAGR